MIEIAEVREMYQKKEVWTVVQIDYLIQNDDRVLYGALRKLYNMQTDEEQAMGVTMVHNGSGFNAYDAPFLSSIVRSLNKYGHLTKGQKEKTRRILKKYVKQLTNIANKNVQVVKLECNEQQPEEYRQITINEYLKELKREKGSRRN